MPEYLYENPNTGEVISVVQTMLEEHIFEKDGIKYNRVFTSPLGATDSFIDPFSAADFVKKTNVKDNYAALFDRSKELAEKRRDKTGNYDPVAIKFRKDYEAARKGRKLPTKCMDQTFYDRL